jgi:DNA-directed RNA polymerase specialized sigma24 family protein
MAVAVKCGRGETLRTTKKSFRAVRGRPAGAHTVQSGIASMERLTGGSGSLVVTVDNATADIARAIHALSDADLVRLKALARLWSRGLPDGVGWTDVLHEAIARALDGSRKWPPGVPIVAFLSGIMRSICDDHWRRARRESEMLVHDEDLADICASGEEMKSPSPERVVAAAQSLAAIDRLFAADPPALKVIAGLAEGLTPPEICKRYGMSEREYDTTRKRMRRALLRYGLAGDAS